MSGYNSPEPGHSKKAKPPPVATGSAANKQSNTAKRSVDGQSKTTVNDSGDAESSASKTQAGGASFRIPKKQVNSVRPGVGADKGGRSALPSQAPIGDSWKVSRGAPGGGPRGGAWRSRGGRGGGPNNARKGPVFPLDEILPVDTSRKPAPRSPNEQQPPKVDQQHRDSGHRDSGHRDSGHRDSGHRRPRGFGDRPRNFGYRPYDASDRPRGAPSRASDANDRSRDATSPCGSVGGGREAFEGYDDQGSYDGSKNSSQTDCSRERQEILTRDHANITATNETVGNWIIVVDPHQALISGDPNVSLKYLEENDIGIEEEVPMETEDVVGEIKQLRIKHAESSDIVFGDLTLLGKRDEVDDVGITTTDSGVTIKQENVKKEVVTGVIVTEQIIVILDTNVLLSDLKLVVEIMNSRTGENDSTMVILLVPWVVMQELDILKDDKKNLKPKLKETARKAVRYLHDLLTTGHPQLKGQTAKESREDVGISIECNDDRILQCCLQYEKVHKNVILFTNDRNLCSKAVINCIRCQSNQGIMSALDGLSPPTTCKALPAQVAEELVLANKNYSTLVMELKTVLRDILSRILEWEMIDAFGDLWKKIVYVNPPWRLMDLMCCYTKHWIAVFGQFLGKHAKSQLDAMHKQLKFLGSSHNHEYLKSLLSASIQFLACFEKRPAYRVHLNDNIRELRAMMTDLNKTRRIKQQKMTAAAEASAAKGTDQVVASNQEPPKKSVLEYLSGVWNYINHTSGLLLDSLQMINPITYDRPKTLASESECMVFIPKFFPALMKLKSLVQGVLLLPPTAPPTQPEYGHMCYQLENFYSILEMNSDGGNLDENLTSEMMWEFYNDPSNRLLLQRGYLQLEDFCTLVYQCSLRIRDKV